jgi:cobalt/nickel transport system permease protein
VFSWFASTQPDGLEWSIARTTGHTELQTTQSALHGKLAAVQKQLGLLVGYKFPLNAKPLSSEVTPTRSVVPEETWPAVDPATSLAGVIGGGVTLALVLCLGYLFRRRTIRALPADRREN